MKLLLTSAIASVLLAATLPVNAGEPLWVNIAQFYGSDTDSGDSFGEAISIDGATLVAASWRKSPGAVYVFERLPGAPTQWVETKKLTPSVPGENNFGISVTVSGDTIAVRANPDQLVPRTYIYERDAGGVGQWGEVGRFKFEYQGPVRLEGDTLALGDRWADVLGEIDAGVVQVFGRDPKDEHAWDHLTTLMASDANAQDHFGDAVAISGDRMLIGAPDVRDLGDDAGAAYIFEHAKMGVWTEVAKLLASDGSEDDGFGYAGALDRETAIVGTFSFGDTAGAYIFARQQGNWFEVQKLTPSDPDSTFGSAVAISGNVAVAGVWGFDLPDVLGPGAAYIFERNERGPDAWGQVARILAPDPQQLDQFGELVDLDGNTLAVGVRSDDDRGAGAGTVYLFSRTKPLLSVSGACPGEIKVSVIGTTPVGQVVLLGAQSEGRTPIPLGPCKGTHVNLDRPKVLFVGTATSGGDLTLTPVVGHGTCGRYLQAVDVGTCVTSDVTEIPSDRPASRRLRRGAEADPQSH